MARQLPTHLSHKSALALLPPSTIKMPIEATRKDHDKHFARWPPHINLLYPFLATPSESTRQGDKSVTRLKEDIRSRIQKAVEPIKAFQIALSADPAGTFSHSKRSKTVWLGPSAQAVQQLQAALQTEFTECDVDKRPFMPHLSVGQAQSDEGAEQLRNEIKQGILTFLEDRDSGAPAELNWNVAEVFVIERKGYHDRFKVVGQIDLGTP